MKQRLFPLYKAITTTDNLWCESRKGNEPAQAANTCCWSYNTLFLSGEGTVPLHEGRQICPIRERADCRDGSTELLHSILRAQWGCVAGRKDRRQAQGGEIGEMVGVLVPIYTSHSPCSYSLQKRLLVLSR